MIKHTHTHIYIYIYIYITLAKLFIHVSKQNHNIIKIKLKCYLRSFIILQRIYNTYERQSIKFGFKEVILSSEFLRVYH